VELVADESDGVFLTSGTLVTKVPDFSPQEPRRKQQINKKDKNTKFLFIFSQLFILYSFKVLVQNQKDSIDIGKIV
jgi:hypothetical protein